MESVPSTHQPYGGRHKDQPTLKRNLSLRKTTKGKENSTGREGKGGTATADGVLGRSGSGGNRRWGSPLVQPLRPVAEQESADAAVANAASAAGIGGGGAAGGGDQSVHQKGGGESCGHGAGSGARQAPHRLLQVRKPDPP